MQQLINSRKTFLVMSIVLIAIATGLLVIHFLTRGRPEGYMDGVGIIDHITTEWTGIGDNHSTITHYFVKYTFQGAEYINELHNFSGNFNVGEKIDILIKASDPNVIQNSGTAQGNFYSLVGCIIIYSVGALFTGLTVFAFYKAKHPY